MSPCYTDSPAHRKGLSLPLVQWPEADRRAWNAACQPAQRLKRGGPAARLKSVTREDHARTYGDFLGFLDRHKRRMNSMTIHVSICRLRRTARYMVPGLDLDWLAEIAKDLALVARPRSKFDRLVLPERLIEAGLTLIHEAEHSQSMTKLARARQVRNALMVALLGFHPIRLKNFAALEIGRSFVKIRGRWWIILSAAETKEKRADERPVNELLTPYIDRYLHHHSPVLVRADNVPSALWLSSNHGGRMTNTQVRNVIAMTTLSTVGVKLSPHLFRTSAASAAAVYGGANPHLGSAVLHHSDPRVTLEHYNRATSLSAAETLRQIVRRYEKQ